MKKLIVKRTPQKNHKSWGHEVEWAINNKYIGKIIHIDRMKSLPKQYHDVKDKTIHVLNGVLIVDVGTKSDGTPASTVVLKEGESVRIQPKTVYRFSAPIEGHVRLIEASTPQYDDITILQNDHGRA